jgi:hypothetical protein
LEIFDPARVGKRGWFMNRKYILTFAIVSGLALTVGILVLLHPSRTAAAPSVRYVEPTGNCGGASPCYSSIQSALDEAMPDDVIKVATGVYSGVHAYTDTNTLVTQALFINKSIILTGGYTITNWSSPDAAAYPVTLDAQNLGRVIYITGTIHVEMDGLRLINGNGGIYIGYSSDVELSNSSILSSTTWEGGYPGLGILNYGTLTLVNSSIVSSTTQSVLSSGGGIENLGTADIYSATIRDNRSSWGCPGIDNVGVMNVFTATIQNNHGGLIKSIGGGICNSGTFYLAGSSVLNNMALIGGGIGNIGIMNILNTTISGNEVNAHGSGILNFAGWSMSGISTTGIMTITYSLIVSNTSAFTPSEGINNSDYFHYGVTPTLSIKNSIVAFNANANCGGTITSLGHNIEDGNSCALNNVGDLINTNPRLGQLNYFGGPTLTYSLEPNSPAIDAGDNIGCPSIDQRGVHRPQGAACDIGAFEMPRLFLPIITVP